ncbi:MAG: hypothetical protein K2Q34_08150 [Alphaproteobacteria bacterium]|nr:hypothetical protein [Alphaproteobacteria bacterium]
MFILFAVFGTGAIASASDFFPSPERAECLSPFMVEIHNENKPVDFRKGIYGEECIEETLNKYARFKGGRITVFNIKDRGDQGVDYFLVDEDASLVIFLEAKGRVFESLFDAKMERDLQSCILRDDKNYNPVAIERIQYRLKTLLKKTPVDQLSRSWCERWCNEVLGSGDRSEEARSLRAAMAAGYGFMRLASLTTGLSRAYGSVTYLRFGS